MKPLFALILLFLCSFTIHWENDFSRAKQTALAEHKYILLNFSGSDWCGPCIRMHKEIFETESFSTFASNQLVMVNADFPRQKKNQLTRSQQQQNEQLAERYDVAGHFPYTVLLSPDGNIVKAWDGLPHQGITAFVAELKQAMQPHN